MAADNSQIHILIIGAGITGTLIAQGLRKAGIRFSIFERDPDDIIRVREWGLSMHWSLSRLEQLLPDDLWARIQEVQNDPFYDPPPTDVLPIYNAETGEHIKDMPLPKVIRVSKRKMRTFCSQNMGVQYGKSLVDVSYDPSGRGVTAIFSDGSTASGTTLVGADGPRSKVRELLLGSERAQVSPVGLVFTNIVVGYGDAAKSLYLRDKHPIYYMALHPSGTFTWISIQDVPDKDNPATWTFQLMNSWLGTPDSSLDDAGRLAALKKLGDVYAEPFRSAIKWIPEGTPAAENKISYWITVPWDNRQGRATLAGDAAHPLPPHRGQGLNQCICDAFNFVSAIKRVHGEGQGLEASLKEYDEELVKRGADEVATSRQNALMLHDWEKVVESPLFTRGTTPRTA